MVFHIISCQIKRRQTIITFRSNRQWHKIPRKIIHLRHGSIKCRNISILIEIHVTKYRAQDITSDNLKKIRIGRCQFIIRMKMHPMHFIGILKTCFRIYICCFSESIGYCMPGSLGGNQISRQLHITQINCQFSFFHLSGIVKTTTCRTGYIPRKSIPFCNRNKSNIRQRGFPLSGNYI